MPTLVIMAAGMGSRYGGLKQIDPVGPGGEIILDYSIYDALRAGFDRVALVIRRDIEPVFRENVLARFEGAVPTAIVHQELDSCLGGCAVPPGRQKPWGTGHAILVAGEVVDQPFAVINADDYYGPDSFRIVADYLTAAAQPLPTAMDEYAMVGFTLRNTLSDFGHVSRGVCQRDRDGFLSTIVEHVGIERAGDGARIPAPTAGDSAEKNFTGDEIVSMNLWGFRPSIFGHLRAQFAEFLASRGHDPKAEFYIPTVVDRLIDAGRARVRILESADRWFGVTYREDKESAVAKIREMIARGIYPEKLWPVR